MNGSCVPISVYKMPVWVLVCTALYRQWEAGGQGHTLCDARTFTRVQAAPCPQLPSEKGPFSARLWGSLSPHGSQEPRREAPPGGDETG